MSRHSIRPVLAALALTVLLAAPAWAARAKDFHQTASLEPDGRLRVCTYKGTIELIPWDKPLVEVHATIAAPDDVSDSYARKTVDATRVVVTGNRGAVTVEVDYDDVPAERGWLGFDSSKILPYAHLKVHAPRKVRLVVEDYKSDIELDGFDGKIQIQTYKGTVRGRDLSGEIVMDTYKGEVDFTRLAGRLDAETYKGRIDIEASRLEGRCRLKTYKGDIRLVLDNQQPVNVISDISSKGTLIDRLGRSAEAGPSRPAEKAGLETVRLSVETHKGQIRLER